MEKSIVIRMHSTLCVSDIRASYSTLIEAMDRLSSIQLAIPTDATVDLSFLQLIEAARQRAAEQGKSLSLLEPAGGELRRALDRSGLLTAATVADRSFWLHEETAQ
ncbi:hypothetical protein CXZ10_11165 [Pleomorphomonas diazotrophica]|uniref:STAS domain-containing protein n=1 Tax=Pleomorphomonas diazotrophica TaxID=1166257 RepID=A0A1I4WIC6_9HYPH|nr:hypothetical protein [Pleomorphomonas diazotrophica]PKR89070.1 hypothetical protein CXZ10_11165 [Pleomorphomonas diazotrophica]SFN13551.1 hypothetical protein SAMN05192571_11767 [Pleomorphomonas diazotrophica]